MGINLTMCVTSRRRWRSSKNGLSYWLAFNLGHWMSTRRLSLALVSLQITTSNAKAFSSSELSSFCFKYRIVLSQSSNYYPQRNGLAESSNKNLITIIKKIVEDNKWSWDSKFKYALWADRITKKRATGKSLFDLVYGLKVTLPVHLKLPAYQLLQQFTDDKDAVKRRIDQIMELDEVRRNTFDNLCQGQARTKENFDKSSWNRSL